ncbi:unnamed protein product, partial [Closterium sp. Naga37s-1]
VLQLSPSRALSVLTAARPPSASLPVDEALEAISAAGLDRLVKWRYLQWLVDEQASDSKHHHTIYALALVDTAAAAAAAAAAGIDSNRAQTENGPRESLVARGKEERQKRLDGWEDGMRGAGDIGAVLAAEQRGGANEEESQREGDEEGEGWGLEGASEQASLAGLWGRVRGVLGAFLESSELYDGTAVWRRIQGERALLREQVVVLRRLGDHTAALRILALELKHSEAAEAYCLQLNDPHAFDHLLHLYLHPGGSRRPMFDAAVRLLHCARAHVDPNSILQALPSDMTVQEAGGILARLMRERVHRLRQGQVVHHLLKAQNRTLLERRMELLSRSVLLPLPPHAIMPPSSSSSALSSASSVHGGHAGTSVSATRCSACHNRLCIDEPFAAMPSGALLCHQCYTHTTSAPNEG